MADLTKVIAKVGDREITEGDLQRFKTELDPNIMQHFQGEEGEKRMVQELVNQELLYLDAKKNKLEEEQPYKEALEKTAENLLKSYAFSKVLDSVKITEEEAKAYFDKNKERFDDPETMVAAHILVAEEDLANDIIKELNDGADFAELAQKHSTCPSAQMGGNLGEFGRGMMVPEFEEVAFGMEEGTISSEPVKTQFGYHIIKVDKKTPAVEADFEKSKDEVTNEALRVKQQEAYLEFIDKLSKEYDVEYL